MRQKGPISVTSFYRPILVFSALVVVCAGMAAHEWRRHLVLKEVSEQYVEVIAITAGHEIEATNGPESQSLYPRLRSMLDPSRIVAAAVYDKTGQRMADASLSSAFVGLLGETIGPESLWDTARVAESPLAGGDESTRQMVRAFVRVRPDVTGGASMLGLAVVLDTPSLGLMSSLWQFHLPLACIAIAAVYTVDMRLRRTLVDPMRAMAREPLETDSETAADGSAEIPESIFELDAIARRMDALRTDARCWQRRSEIIERRVDTHVARETKKIIHDLNRVKKEAWQDSLTGINNRRYLEEEFPRIFAAQQAARRDLAVIMIDLDNFKRLNDTRGHAAGDDVLRFVGELLRQCLRADDCAIRYGGDEFIVILPGVSAENARGLAQRMLALFAQRVKAMLSSDLTPTMTAGVASMVHNGTEAPTELIACADHALLAAKQAGKHRALLSTVQGRHFRGKPGSPRIPLRTSTPVAANL